MIRTIKLPVQVNENQKRKILIQMINRQKKRTNHQILDLKARNHQVSKETKTLKH